MSAPARQREVYDDWSGGGWGDRGPFKADKNQYRSINLQVYANGTLGPRPGWVEQTTTGTGPNIVAASGPEFYGIIWLPDTADGGDLLFVSGSDASETRKLDIDTWAWSATSLGIPSTPIIASDPNGHSFAYQNANNVVVGATKVYNKSSDTTTTITYPDAFAPVRAIFYGARLYAWGDATYPNRVYYSDADSYTFRSGQSFNIGAGGGAANLRSTVMDAWVLKDMLLFYVLPASVTDTQLAAEYWSLTGPNVINGQLKRIGFGTWPSVQNNAVVYKDAVLFEDFLYEKGGICVHDGAALNTQALAHLGPRAGVSSQTAAAGVGAAATIGVPGVVLPYRIGSSNVDPTAEDSLVGEYYEGGLQGWELVNSTWTKQLYWQGAEAQVVDNDRRFLYGITPWKGDRLLAVTNTASDGSGTYRVFSRRVCVNRPSGLSDTTHDPLEEHADLPGISGLACQLWLKPVMQPDYSPVRIERIVVEFDYWKNSNFPEDVELKVRIGQHRIESGEFTLSDEVVADVSALAESTENYPNRARVVIPVPALPFASAAQVRFTSAVNIAFDNVIVDYLVDLEKGR